MADPKFAHLHLHTHYSLLDGANRIPELVAQTKKLGMDAVAITDHGNLYGAIEFYKECKAADINPVIGYEAYLAPGDRRDKKGGVQKEAYTHLTLLAKNNIGFRNLIKLSSIAFLEGFYYNPRIDREVLQAHSEGLICLSGCLAGEFNQSILKNRPEDATKLAKFFHKLFPNDFYIELQNNGIDLQDACTPVAVEIANKLGIPTVATADAHYLCADDAEAHDVLFCINTRRKRDPRKKQYPEGRLPNPYYVRGPKDMYDLFPGHADAVARSHEIASKVDIDIDFKKRHFPVFSQPAHQTPDEYLRELCEQGVIERYGDKATPEVYARLKHELGIIFKMGFSSYFLIVWDFVRFARQEGIPCSARGSGCGSLVSYALYLSHVDPLDYDLLFERFLDPNRSEAPDIDIDFCQDRRERVIQYVKQKYGADSVAQIGTFGTLAAKAALKDVGRVLDIPLDKVNYMCKLVPMKGTISLTLDDALKMSPDFRQEYDSNPDSRQWVDIARKLEGMNRGVGTHAAGVVIANGPITDYVPVQRATRRDESGDGSSEAVVTTQWEMGIIEKVGLLKMDFLGLRTLTLLDNALKMIKRTRGVEIDVHKLPLDDAPTYQLLQRGDAKGVFQFESDGIRDLLKRMKPDNIRDIVACTALYRPGPLEGGMVDEYIECKHGRKQPDYPHPMVEEVLSETFGVMCIQEDTLVAMADGSEKAIRDIRRLDLVQSLNLSTREFEVKECHGAGPTRRCDGLRLRLENGFAVVLTPDHKVWTWAGWKEVQYLDLERDIVATGVTMTPDAPSAGELAPWLGADEDVAYLLGLLTGDGCLTGSAISIATGVEEAHDKIVTWLGERFPSLRVAPYFHDRSWYAGLSHPELLNDPLRGNRKTRLHDLIERVGLKCLATAERVPPVIFRCPAGVRAAFLAGVFDSDGCLATSDRNFTLASVTSASPGLLQDLRRLCQLVGVPMTLTAQRLQVWGTAGLRDAIGPYLVAKTFPAACQTGETVGWVPREELFSAVLAGESLRTFAARTGIQHRGVGHAHPFIKSSTARKAGIDLGDVRFYRIESVETVPDQQFYGMSVADHHNLVANGVVVKNCYQEQVMRMLNRMGGIELPSAYACIKAISKKKYDIIDARQKDFVSGAVERGMSKEKATEIFEQIVKFGGYGFNKSHSAAYAHITYHTAYLKNYYPAEFMAALLSSEIDDGNKRDMLVDHIADARKMGVPVLPPDVNKGQSDFDVVDGKIVFGLTAIKGLGRGAAEEIVRARNVGGPFRDLFDFCERIDLRLVTRAAIEKLIKAGAMDCFGRDKRAACVFALPRAAQAAEDKAVYSRRGQRSFMDMFDEGGDDGEQAPLAGSRFGEGLPDLPEWPELEKLKFEKESLDFYISSHPLAQFDEQLRRFRTHDTAALGKLSVRAEVRIGGMVTSFDTRVTKAGRNPGSRFALFRVEDFTGSVKCVLWSDQFARFKDDVDEDRIVLVEGHVEWREGTSEPDLIVSKILSLEQARKDLTRGMVLRMPYGDDPEALTKLEGVASVLKRFRGPCPVYLTVRDVAGKSAQFKLNESFWVNATELKVDELELLLGPGSVLFTSRG